MWFWCLAFPYGFQIELILQGMTLLMFSSGNISVWSLQLYEEWYLDTVCSYHQQLNGFIPDCSCMWRVIKILIFKESLKVIVDPIPSAGILFGHAPAKCCGSDEDQVEQSKSEVMLQRSSGQILTPHQDKVEGLNMQAAESWVADACSSQGQQEPPWFPEFGANRYNQIGLPEVQRPWSCMALKDWDNVFLATHWNI